MPSLLYYLRRAGEQSFRETLNQARSLASTRIAAVLLPAYDKVFSADLTVEELLHRAGASTLSGLTGRLKAREWPRLPLLLPNAPAAAEGLIGVRMDWHADPKSGYRWDKRLHSARIPIDPGTGVDIKGPWELSRCHDLVTLGLAYRETEDERFSNEVIARILDWIEENPFRRGVNWVSPMEAGIRAVNWCWAFALVRTSSAVNEAFAGAFLKSLHTHATYVRSNLEFRQAWKEGRKVRLNSNHYLCDLAGLLSIGMLFPELALEEHASFAARELKVELMEQITADGADYEHSTAYHRFVLEIFEYAFRLLSEPAPERLQRMRAFAAASTHPDGTLAQIGDNDGGRLLPPFPLKIEPGRHTAVFPHAGFYSMRGRNSHVFISASRVGMRGLGSHSHNDVLSFEYFAGRAWIVDPGTYLYLSDTEARNWFRSTAAHNTVRVDREEIRPFHREAVFQMVDRADIRVSQWETTGPADVFEAEHTGYSHLSKPVVHRRRFEFAKAAAQLTIQDALTGKGTHEFEWFFHVHPDVDVEQTDGDFILSHGGDRVRLRIECPGAEMMATPGWFSPAYGVRVPSTMVAARVSSTPPIHTRIIIEPC